MIIRKTLILITAFVYSSFCPANSDAWISRESSVGCRFLVSKYFPEFTIDGDRIVLDLESLEIVDKKGLLDPHEFYTYQSKKGESIRTLTLIEGDSEDSWTAAIPDQMLACRMKITAITRSEKDAMLSGIGKYLQANTSASTIEKPAPQLSPQSLARREADVIETVGLDLIQELERLKAQLAQLKIERNDLKAKIDTDISPPSIAINQITSDEGVGLIKGMVSDNVGIAELRIQGQAIGVEESGSFEASIYVPDGGINAEIVITDFSGLQTRLEKFVDRSEKSAQKVIFPRLNPTQKRSLSNGDAVALVIGIGEYEKVTPAAYADEDAKIFADYVRSKLGVNNKRVMVLKNDKADITGILLSLQDWLRRSIRPGKSDVYVFFAGHGLASADGKRTFLIPYDSSPRLLNRTAISRKEFFDAVASGQPRSVTVFLDTCYSGNSRGGGSLIAGRPLRIKVGEQPVPTNFTVFTAAGNDQVAMPLEEAQHGLFSYFLMKGMEGEADVNKDLQITAAELHDFVRQNVIQQSGGSQVPELQGDTERVLVQFK